MEVDFGATRSRRIAGLAFLPREGHADQFWDSASLQGSGDRSQWSEIAELRLSAPPQDWILLRFANDRDYRYYRFVIKGGFAAGRFIALSGIRMYEAETATKP